MNCKPGDLAIVVYANIWPRHLGLIVDVIRRCPAGYVFVTFDGRLQKTRTDSCFVVRNGSKEWLQHDSSLRPIRDQPGEDEMLRIAGKPEKVGA